MWFFALAGSAIVPSILLFWYIYSRDIHPEPRGMLLGTFGLGAATAVPVLIIVLPLNALLGVPADTWLKATYTAFVHAAIPEECFKYLVLMTFCYRSRHFDEPFDGIVYGATASLGFATLENILYVSQGGIGVAIMRAFTAVPGHTFSGVVMGYFVGRAKFASEGRGWLAFQGLLYAILLHGFYDLFLMTGTGWFILSLPVLILEVVLGILLIRRMRVDGFIPPVQAAFAGMAPQAMPGYPMAGPMPGQGAAPALGPDGLPWGYPQGAPAQPYAPAPAPAPAPGAAPYPPNASAPGQVPTAPAPVAQYAASAPVGYGPTSQPYPSAAPAAAPPPPRAGLGKIIGGAMLASVCAVGALATLGALVQPSSEDPGSGALVGIALVSILGLAGGILLFSFGLSARRPK